MKPRPLARLWCLAEDDARRDHLRQCVNDMTTVASAAPRRWQLDFAADEMDFLGRLDGSHADAALIDCSTPSSLLDRAAEVPDRMPLIVITDSNASDAHAALLDAGAQEFIPRAALTPLLLERTLRYCARATELESRIEFLAQHDVLTGLPNRNLFHKQVSHALLGADRHGRCLAIASLEIDHFHELAREQGQDAAEQVLRIIGQRLARTLRRSDLVARAHDEEFLLMLECSPDLSDLSQAADKILGAIAEPMVVEGQQVRLTASMGIAIYPRSAEDAAGLQRQARAALQRALQSGHGDFRLFDAELELVSRQRVRMERELPGAIERGELKLRYQPRLEAASGRITGAEVLLRWDSPAFGAVSPDTFVPIAEQSGAINRIGAWVLDEAMSRTAGWRAAGHDVRLGVNVAAGQLAMGDFTSMISSALTRHDVPAAALELELTERAFVENVAAHRDLFDALTELGVGLAVDDFGVGYSSLSYLKDFPIHTLKIDRGFINGVPEADDDAAIVRAVIALGHALGLHVVAEGIERDEQLQFLRTAGCDEVQGFLVGRPLDASDFGALLDKARLEQPA